ncbi:MAG: hypothetical protein ACRCVG_02985 [Methanobacteriaceae archaeon]
MTVKVRTTLNLDKNIMKTIKIMALNRETTQTKVINDLLKKAIENEDKINGIPDYLIANKNKIPDDEGLNELIGSIKVPKGFNPVESVNEIRKGI